MAKKITQNVNKDKFLNDLPKVVPEFSKWANKKTNYLSCNAGQIVPIFYDEIIPNEKRKITLGMISHTTTPIVPIFPSTYTEIRVFFVPNRLSSDLLNGYSTRKSPWVKVFGEDNKSTSADIIVPLTDQKLPDVTSSFASAVNTYKSNVSTKNNVFDFLDLAGSVSNTDYNFLQLAAYELIYQRHYRNENYESATDSPLYKTLYNAYNSNNVPSLSTSFVFERAAREKDYFTGAKPFTQKASSPVEINLGSTANVIAKGTPHYMVANTSVKFGTSESQSDGFHNLGLSVESIGGSTSGNLVSDGTGVQIPAYANNIVSSNLVADLSTAKGISIEELRILVKTQELLEKDALYGNLYAEQLNAHFACCPLDLTLQDPQELNKVTITSHMQAIFQTSSTSGESSILGTIGANSTTQTDPFVILPETKFYEHGILMICAVHKLQNVYSSNYFKPKFAFKKSRFDFYTPELNDLGFQPVSKNEAYIGNDPVVAFNEAFAEYRYSFNQSHGELNNSFPFWAPAIGNEYGSIAAMYKEDTGILDKSLSITSSTAPQFYDAWGFEQECTKPMSLHSIPGMDGVI